MSQDDIAAALSERARAFDLSALLDLLSQLYPEYTLQYRSRLSRASAGSMVERIEIHDTTITLELNIGLVSSDTCLTSYFFDLFDGSDVGTALRALVACLDDELLRARAAIFRPESSAWLLSEPGEGHTIREAVLKLARLDSPWTLRWLFSTVFPEIEVRVSRGALALDTLIQGVQLGRSLMGMAALGGRADVQPEGFTIVLRTEESTTWGDEAWAVVASRRITESILPRLAGTRLYLRVILVLCDASAELALQSDRHLGFDPLGASEPPERLFIFEGQVPDQMA